MKIIVKIMVSLLLIIVTATAASALSVDLVFPTDNAVFVDSSTITFKCKATGSDLRFLELYTNVNGWSKKKEVSNPQSNTEISFSVQNIPNGNYIWNCKVIDGIEGLKFSTANRSFSVNLAPNSPPTYAGGLSSQTWNKNSAKSNVFDLDNYFSDPEGKTLTYSVTGNSNININIDAGNIVSFSQPTGWFGTEKVRFVASDSISTTQSNEINLTVLDIQQNPLPNSNTAPTFIEDIPDQIKNIDEDSWFLDLENYAEDEEDPETKLNWSVTSIDEDLIKIEIDNVNKMARFISQGVVGTDTVKFTVTDTGGMSASQNIEVRIKGDNSFSDEFDEITEFDEVEKPIVADFKIIGKNPQITQVSLDNGEVMDFSIDTNRRGDYEWYLDNVLTKEKTGHFNFNTVVPGKYNLTIIATDLLDQVIETWEITVNQEEIKVIIEKQEPICGNGIIEENENCISCSADVKCNDMETCEEGICKVKKKDFLSITGNVIKDINLPKKFSDLRIILSISVAVAVVILSMFILLIRKRNKLKYSNLAEFEEKETFLKRQQRKLREWYIKKEQKKQNKLNLKGLNTKKQDEILITAPSLSTITAFIKENINKGNSKRSINKALREKGWTRLQIWRAFRKIKK